MKKPSDQTKISPVLNVNQAVDYLGFSRTKFWRLSQSIQFPSKVQTDRGDGYRILDLQKWRCKKLVEQEAKKSKFVGNFKYLGKVLFILFCPEFARSCVMKSAIDSDVDPDLALEQFEDLLTSLDFAHKKLLVADSTLSAPEEVSTAYDDFVSVKGKVIRQVWPEIDINKLSVIDF